MKQSRPSVFIGSSSEGQAVAKAIQRNLDPTCEAVVWTQGVFTLSEATLETLVRKLSAFDFAVLALTPDDVVESRERTSQSPRDNVLLELGMFIGCIGRRRTFIVHDRTAQVKLPSDLAGVVLAGYQSHDSGNWTAALGPCCTQLEEAILELGPRVRNKGALPEPQDLASTAGRALGRRGGPEAIAAIQRIIAGAAEAKDGFLCVAGMANKELFGPTDAHRTFWPAVQEMLQQASNGGHVHHVRVMFLDPESQSAHAREIFETRPNRSVPVNTRQLIRATLGQARLLRNKHPNLHIRLSPDMPCFLFFNQNEMLYHPYLNSAVGPDVDSILVGKQSETYAYGARHFESHWRDRWMLLDLGNVLVNFDHAQVSSKLWEHLGKHGSSPAQIPSREELHAFIFGAEGTARSRNFEVDLGRHDVSWLRDEFCDHFHCSVDLGTFRAIWNSIFSRINSEALRCISELQKAGIKVGICSNTNGSHWQWICETYPELTRSANAWFLSYELHACKPDFEFFERVCERTSVPAAHHVLIDDRAENIQGARSAGMQAEIFSSFQQVLEFVERRFWTSRHPDDLTSPTG